MESQAVTPAATGAGLHFALVLHAHQPVGNPDAVVRQIELTSYRPVLKALAEHPTIRFSLHLSGSLLDRLENLAPELLELIGGMVERGQAELIGGAFHEALLPLIPAVDRHGQLVAMRRRLEDAFGCEVRGAWVAERFWEPSLAAALAEAGYQYTLLDEHGFLQVGFDEHQLCRPFLTEDQGHPLGIFPISKGLRYLLPYVDPEQALQVLTGRAHTHPGSLWVFADDLEKFGSWPGTFDRVHERGWWRDFLGLLAAAPETFRPVTLGEAWTVIPSGGLAYLPATSYPEILRWSLPPGLRPDQGRPGFPRHFLVRYPEVNLIHKRMLAASQAVHALAKPDADLLDQLWMSQTACPYWYGWFGGAYLPSLRMHAKAAATMAETRALKKGRRPLNYFTTTDFDLCGHDEVIVSTPSQWLLVKPTGGGVVAWEDRRTGFDPLACMNAWPEEGSPADKHQEPLLPFEDLVLAPGQTLENLVRGNLAVLHHLRRHRYDSIPIQDEFPIGGAGSGASPGGRAAGRAGPRMGVRLELEPLLALPQGERRIGLRKTFLLDSRGRQMELELTFRNLESHVIEFPYGMRVPLGSVTESPSHPYLLSFPEVGLTKISGLSVGEVSGVTDIVWAPGQPETGAEPSGADPKTPWSAPKPARGRGGVTTLAGTRIRADRPLTIWYSPLVTEILLEGKRTPIFQAVILLFLLPIRLEPGETAPFRFRLGWPGQGSR